MKTNTMAELAQSELEQIEGGGGWLGSLLITWGATAGCMIGGGIEAGAAGGPIGEGVALAVCTGVGAAAGISSLMS